MGKDDEQNIESDNQQDDSNFGNSNGDLPAPDPDLSDYFKKDDQSGRKKYNK